MRRGLLILGLLWAGLCLPDAALAKRCRCAHGVVHTSRSCFEACGRGSLSGSVRREAERSEREHDGRSDAQARRARSARADAADEATGASRPAPPPSMVPRTRRDPVPKQEGLTNIEERPLPAKLGDGVFCSEGEVILPKRPTREMREFCRRQ